HHIRVASLAFAVRMSGLPSDEKRGRSSWFGVRFNRRDSPPLAGTIHKCEVFVFAARSTSTQSNTTHLPSGEGTGAPTRLSAIMSSNVKGCFWDVCAKAVAARARLAARKAFMSGKAPAEALGAQLVSGEHTPLACSCRQLA